MKRNKRIEKYLEEYVPTDCREEASKQLYLLVKRYLDIGYFAGMLFILIGVFIISIL